MGFSKLQDILDVCNKKEVPFWRAVLLKDVKERFVTEEASFETMRGMYLAMRTADNDYDGNLKSASGLAGGDGAKLENYRVGQPKLMGDFLSTVMEKAIKMGESNACMKRIVAAPTAGSCGVIPAVLLSYEEYNDVTEDKMVESLFVAAGIGEVIATSASISGAEGGCQAEIGSASAMAAGAICYLEGGNNEEIVHAAALALKNTLGLTCDPVAGLVEVPCIKRNASAAVNSVVACQLTLAGVRSAIVPDEVVDSMRRIGKLIPGCLRETSQEGLAITPSAQKVVAKLSR